MPPAAKKMKRSVYEAEYAKLQLELVQMQDRIRKHGLRVCVLFEGRDAAGKGGAIQRIMEPLNPRYCKHVALGTPTEREQTQWYFQRYVAHLPAAGEIVLFDRSWYNRAGVERVMGFCTEEQYLEFLRTAPQFEQLLIDDGILLIKYWFSVSDEEQEKRFKARIDDPLKRWKISPMDLEARARWFDYAKAKDTMFEFTDTPESPWWSIDADVKRRARLNCIRHLLETVPHEKVRQPRLKLPARQKPDPSYQRPPIDAIRWVPDAY